MPTQSLTDKYRDQLDGVLHCFDRVIVLGSLHPLCYAKGMTHYLSEQHIRIFDYAQFAQPLSEAIRQQAETLATARDWRSSSSARKTSERSAHSSPVETARDPTRFGAHL